MKDPSECAVWLINDQVISVFYSCDRTGSIMEPRLNQIWPRVFQRLHRTSALPVRRHSASAERATVPASTDSRRIRPPLLVSRLYQPSNLRDVGQDTRLQGEMTCRSQRLMQQAGLIYPSNPGCYYYLPATVRSMEKLVRFLFVKNVHQVSMLNPQTNILIKFGVSRDCFWNEFVGLTVATQRHWKINNALIQNMSHKSVCCRNYSLKYLWIILFLIFPTFLVWDKANCITFP